MIIEDVEALKKWVMDTVAPICDADPEPLSRYCLALVKKDKSESELREFCLDQLEVFLQGKTAGFVDVLFDALKSKAYLQSKGKPDVSDNSQETPSSTTDDIKIKEEPKEPPVKRSNSKEDQKDLRDVIRKRHSSRSPSPRRREFDERRRRVDDRRIRRRSRSRSPYRPPRARSPRAWSPRGRSKSPRHWSPRARSPRLRSRSPRGRSPRRIVRDSPKRWSRSPRSRSPRGRSPGYRSPKARARSPRSPKRSGSWSRSRSRSRSTPRSRSRSGSRSPGRKRDSRGPTPTMDNGKYIESSIPVMGVTVYSTARTEPNETKPPAVKSLPRCKDYDEQGFCMRGDLCPFDHGVDPVIVDDVPITSYPPPSGPPPPPTSGAPPMPPHAGPPPQIIRPPPPRPEHFEPYNPEAPAMSRPPPYWTGPPPPLGGPPPQRPPGMFMMHGPPLPPNMNQQQRPRDLVNIQTMPNQRNDEPPIHPPGTEPVHIPPPTSQPERTVIAPKRPYDNGQDRHYGGPPSKKPFDYNRIGGYRKPGANNTNTTLELRKVPRENNNIAKLYEYFGKFGTLTNVQVSYEGDPEGAVICFANNAQAFAAYRSSEPVFNNRFIKVFWHKPKDKKDQGDDSNTTTSDATSTTPTPPPPKQKDERNVKLRVEIPPAHKLSLNNTIPKQYDASKPEKSIVFTPSLGVITKTVYNPKVSPAGKPKLTSPTAVGSAQFVSKIEAIKKQEELKREASKKKAEIQKQKQELLQKQIEQQKKLIEKLEKNKVLAATDKEKIKETLKILTGSIERLTKEVVPVIQKSTPPVTPELPVITSPEQAKKEILDTELELFNKQQSGEDTIILRKKLNELTKQATAMGLIGRGRGRGAIRGGRGRGFIPNRGAMTWVAGGAARGTSPSFPVGRGASQFPAANTSRSLDNRPKQFEVTGFKAEQKDLLETHFKQYGMVERIDFDDVDNSAIVSFKTRQDAEHAVLRGAKLQDSILTMKWHTGVKINIRLNVSSDDSFTEHHDTTDEGTEEIDEEALLADEEDLLRVEDEEEEDEESRSWRR
ncbi:RNA-binding protein 26-like [Mytilus trossulus]